MALREVHIIVQFDTEIRDTNETDSELAYEVEYNLNRCGCIRHAFDLGLSKGDLPFRVEVTDVQEQGGETPC